MKALGLEAHHTAKKLPGRVSPQSYGNNWPTFKADYPNKDNKIRVGLTASTMSRHDLFSALVNNHLNEHDRKEIRTWLRLKYKEGSANIGVHCDKFGLSRGIYAQRIDKLFQILVEKQNVTGGLIPQQVLENSKKIGTNVENDKPMPKSPTIWRDGKHVEASPEFLAEERNRLSARLLKANAMRQKKSGRSPVNA